MIGNLALLKSSCKQINDSNKNFLSMLNRLAEESSPYLQMHSHNPVDWYPWGPEAFERAKKERKLLIVSIGYAACHWCHVMEKESFTDSGNCRNNE